MSLVRKIFEEILDVPDWAEADWTEYDELAGQLDGQIKALARPGWNEGKNVPFLTLLGLESTIPGIIRELIGWNILTNTPEFKDKTSLSKATFRTELETVNELASALETVFEDLHVLALMALPISEGDRKSLKGILKKLSEIDASSVALPTFLGPQDVCVVMTAQMLGLYYYALTGSIPDYGKNNGAFRYFLKEVFKIFGINANATYHLKDAIRHVSEVVSDPEKAVENRENF